MIIGIDPHKMSHTANAVDPATNTTISSLRIEASLAGYRQLMRWAKQFPERRWAVENAHGLGRHLSQWLVARDEHVLDVPSTATSRVRELSRGSRRKTDVIDAAAAASVAALHGDATVVAGEDYTTVFALLEERRANLAAQRVRVANQLHAVLRDLTAGGAALAITAKSAQGTCPGPGARSPLRRYEFDRHREANERGARRSRDPATRNRWGRRRDRCSPHRPERSCVSVQVRACVRYLCRGCPD